ncbi:MAG: hypothetical protein WC185_02840 [Acholeplasmataceae bacterium]
MKLITKLLLLFSAFTGTTGFAYGQNQNELQTQNQSDESVYYPVDSSGIMDSRTVSLHYWANKNGNKSYAEMQFSDGAVFTLLPNCEGEYLWCIQNNDDEEIGYLKIKHVFTKEESYGEFATDNLLLDVKYNTKSAPYTKYLSKMTGSYGLW